MSAIAERNKTVAKVLDAAGIGHRNISCCGATVMIDSHEKYAGALKDLFSMSGFAVAKECDGKHIDETEGYRIYFELKEVASKRQMASLQDLPPAKLIQAYDQASATLRPIGDRMIDAGRGCETFEATREKAKEGDELSIEYCAASNKLTAVADEMDRRRKYHGSLKRTPS